MKKLPFWIFFAMFVVIAYSCIKAAEMPSVGHKSTGRIMQSERAELDNSLVYTTAASANQQ